MGYKVKSIESDDELHLANELMAGQHAAETPALRHWLLDVSHRYPGFRREHTRAIFANHEAASALRITTDTILLGEARLKMGGIGWVTTSERHRRKGLCRRLMADAIEYLRHNNYHVSMLFGIPGFYHRFGYTTSLAEYVVRIATVDALTFHSPLKLREAKPGEIPALQKLHSANNTDIACSILRTTGHYRNRWDLWQKWYVLTDDQGKVEAYFIAGEEGDHLRVDDVAVADPGLCAGVMAATGELASDASLGHIRYYVPPRHFLARYLLQFRSFHEMHVDRDAGGMLSFVDIGETLESLIPEWENLLSRHLARELRTEFTVVIKDTQFRVRANRGAIDVAAMPGKSKISLSQADLMHLVTGYRYLDDILAESRSIMSSEARLLMSAIFPKRTPFVWRFDRF